ncbi:hypothetical protein NQZ68_022331 [Xyrichtys novacula]|uniref:Uncharacterized protein n=1 Tax=Xyrichtys novacula TaxID=13765 RepID=A0AAV1F9H4_XYRNO|nr:hypothetical protein NQZ68_022331 [Xyrichtys novacula]
MYPCESSYIGTYKIPFVGTTANITQCHCLIVVAMISRLAIVGGTDTNNFIRRMLAAALTNALASQYNWAGKHDKRCSSTKKAFKNTAMQGCLFAAARQFDEKMSQKQFEDIVKSWLRFAPNRQGGIPRNAPEQQGAVPKSP